MSHNPRMGDVGSVLPLHDVKEEELSKTSRQQSCVSTSPLAPTRSKTISNNEKPINSIRSLGQKLDHAILHLAPAFFSLNMVSTGSMLVNHTLIL
jgi:hypothetical protein